MKKMFLIMLVLVINVNACLKPTLTSEEMNRFKQAIFNNNAEYISEILNSRKIDLNDEDNFGGYLPVQLAVHQKKLKLVEMFINSGADINKKNKTTKGTCAHEVLDPEMLNYLISKGLYINAQDNMGNTGLHRVSMDLFLPIMEVFITNGADIEIKNNYGITPIFMTVIGKNYNAFMLLIKNKAKLDVYTDKNANILHYYASSAQDNRIFNEILKRNPGLLYDKDNDVQCLIMASSGGERTFNDRKKFINTLLAMGININKQNRSGSTALHRAALFNDNEMVSFLLKTGANKNIKDNEGLTPLDYAVKNKNDEIIKLMR